MLKRLITAVLIFAAVAGLATDQRIHSNSKRGLFRDLFGDSDTARIVIDSTKWVYSKDDSLMLYDPATGDSVSLYEIVHNSGASAIYFADQVLLSPSWDSADSIFFDTNQYGTFTKTVGGTGEGDIVFNWWPDSSNLVTHLQLADTVAAVYDSVLQIVSDSTVAPGGTIGQIQYNDGAGNFAGASTTISGDAINLASGGAILTAGENTLKLSSFGIVSGQSAGLNSGFSGTISNNFAFGQASLSGSGNISSSGFFRNIAIIENAGRSVGINCTGQINNNCFIGYNTAYNMGALSTVTIYNNYGIGTASMYFMGYTNAGYINDNFALGTNALYQFGYTTSGEITANIGIGTDALRIAGKNNATGSFYFNVGIGYRALYSYSQSAGFSYVTGIGYGAGQSCSGSYRLYISAHNTRYGTDALIYGEGDNQLVRINNTLELSERSSDPANPAEGYGRIWMSNGAASGDDGDLMFVGTAGAVTTTKTFLFDTDVDTDTLWAVNPDTLWSVNGDTLWSISPDTVWSVDPDTVQKVIDLAWKNQDGGTGTYSSGDYNRIKWNYRDGVYVESLSPSAPDSFVITVAIDTNVIATQDTLRNSYMPLVSLEDSLLQYGVKRNSIWTDSLLIYRNIIDNTSIDDYPVEIADSSDNPFGIRVSNILATPGPLSNSLIAVKTSTSESFFAQMSQASVVAAWQDKALWYTPGASIEIPAGKTLTITEGGVVKHTIEDNVFNLTGSITVGDYYKTSGAYTMTDSSGANRIIIDRVESAEDAFRFGDQYVNTVIRGGSTDSAIVIDDGDVEIHKTLTVLGDTLFNWRALGVVDDVVAKVLLSDTYKDTLLLDIGYGLDHYNIFALDTLGIEVDTTQMATVAAVIDTADALRERGVYIADQLFGNPNWITNGDSLYFTVGYGIDLSIVDGSGSGYDVSFLFKADTSATGLATKKTVRDSLNDVTMGEGYIDADSTIALNVASKYYAIDFEAGDGNQNITGTNDSTWTIIRDGWYHLNYSMVVDHSVANKLIHVSFFVSDTEDTQVESVVFCGAVGTSYQISGTGIAYLESGDALKIKMKSDGAGTATIKHANANIFKLR